MNYNEFELVVKKLEELELIEKVGNVFNWFRKLNKTRINNLLHLSKEKVLFFKSYEDILLDLNFLNSENYIEDINDIYSCVKYNREEYLNVITKLLKNNNFINSPFHRNDLKKILKCNNLDYINLYVALAVNNISIKGGHHIEDFEKLESKNANYSLKIKEALLKVMINKNSIESKYHENHVDLIKKSKQVYTANNLALLATTNHSIENNNHIKDMEILLFNVKKEKSDCLTKIALSKVSLDSIYHQYDMMVILSSDDLHVPYLTELALSRKSLNTTYHLDDMKLISNAKDISISPYLLRLIKESSTNDKIIHDIEINSILNCTNKEKIKILTDIYTNAKLDNCSNYDEIIKFISKIEDINLLENLFNFINDYSIDKINCCFEILMNLKDENKIKEELMKFIKNNNKRLERENLENLTNIEKINILRKNIYNYIDGDKTKEIPTKVFGLKEIKQ